MKQKRRGKCAWEQFIFLTCGGGRAFSEVMNATTTRKTRWCWRKDLAGFRGLSDQERAGFLLVLEWFENFRLRHEMEADRDAAKAFWRLHVATGANGLGVVSPLDGIEYCAGC